MAEVTDADDLYGLAPDAFVAARNALVKRLRADGRKEEAAQVAQLRRPPVTAWALNAVAREAPDLLAGALEAGGRLQAATEAAVSGREGADLRAAAAEERRATHAVLEVASRHLGGRGGAGAQQTMAATLRAALVDQAVADQLRRGTLADDHEASGFELAGGLDVAADGRGSAAGGPRSRTDRAAAARQRREEEARARRVALEEEVAALEAQADEARAAAEEAEAQARVARQAAERVAQRLDRARAKLEAHPA